MPIEAIPAAINTGTSLLLGLWASAGADHFAGQLSALKAAIETYGEQFASLVAGISVGSEDLYRITETAASNGNNLPGAQPDTIVSYISQVREAIAGTVLDGAKIGHVDTWTVWANSSNQAVFDAVDFVGMDGYPYFEKEHENPIDTAASAFQDAIDRTNAGTGGKELWITETGWPTVGDTIRDAVPSVENAQKYWRTVGCPRFGNVNIFWYILQDRKPVVPETSFGVVDENYNPLFDMSCDDVTDDAANTTTTSVGGDSSSATTSEPISTETSEEDVDDEDGTPITTEVPETETETETITPTTTTGEGNNGNDEYNSSDAQTTLVTETTSGGSSEPTVDGGSGDADDNTNDQDSGSGSGSDSSDDNDNNDLGSGSGDDDSEGSSGDTDNSNSSNDEPETIGTNTAPSILGGSSGSYAACVLAVMVAVVLL